MKLHKSLFRQSKTQPVETAFAHFYPINGDFDEPFRVIASNTMEGRDAWAFQQKVFIDRHPYTQAPKLKNYLNYTFKRLLELENITTGRYFFYSKDKSWICFNTGLQNSHRADLLAVFQQYQPKPGMAPLPTTDWIFKACCTSTEHIYRNHFGPEKPEIAWYSTDSRDFIFNTSYHLEKDSFDHLLERAKERAGLQNASDEVARTYLRGAIDGLVPKIKRNYKVAIPVYYVEESRMQLLLPFEAVSNVNDVSCFVVERNDTDQVYSLRTIFDLDKAYFSARLITRPDKEWLNP
jgi:hypothetical protein